MSDFVPSVFVLMTGKTRLVYDEVFCFVKKLTNMRLKIIVTDFEVAIQHSLHFTFGKAVLQCDYFHYSQAIFRMAHKLGFVSYANQDVEH